MAADLEGRKDKAISERGGRGVRGKKRMCGFRGRDEVVEGEVGDGERNKLMCFVADGCGVVWCYPGV